MYSNMFLVFFAFIVVFAAISAQDVEECVKIQKAIGCCREPIEPKDSENMMISIMGDPKKLENKLVACMGPMKDELKSVKQDETYEALECLAECVLNETEIMTSTFKFNQEVAFKLLENDPEYKAFAKKHMDICEEKTAKMPRTGKCKGNFVLFAACLVEEVANNCPKGGPLAGKPECDVKDLSMSKCNPLAALALIP